MSEADTLPPQPVSSGEVMTEAEIDETLAGSFPASDPPSWTLGTERRAVVKSGHEKQTQPNQKRPAGENAPEGD